MPHHEPRSGKVVRWADLCRAWAMVGLMSDFSKAECWRARREILLPLVGSGRIIKVGRGRYRLADNWEQNGVLIHRTQGGNELWFNPGH